MERKNAEEALLCGASTKNIKILVEDFRNHWCTAEQRAQYSVVLLCEAIADC